jgi:hypothetical protein
VPRPRRNPEDRARATHKQIKSIRRRYKTNIRTRRHYVAGEADAIGVSVAVMKIAGFSNIQIAQVLGISRGQVAEHLDDPRTSDLLVTLRVNLTNAALELLETYTIEAILALVNILRTAQDDKVVIQAAAEILDRAGIPKVSRSERKIESEETTTFTDDGIVDAIRQLPPEAQEEAAKMIEQLESFLTENSDEREEVEDESN